jgi:hypothetical protein
MPMKAIPLTIAGVDRLDSSNIHVTLSDGTEVVVTVAALLKMLAKHKKNGR